MTLYGYIRTSKARQPGQAGSDPEVQRHQLRNAGVDDSRIYADVSVSGTKGVSSRTGWAALDARLDQGDVLVVSSVDRIGRRNLDVMYSIYALHHRGIRLRSLAPEESQWAAYLDADPDSPEWFMGAILATFAAYGAQQERQSISRRTKAGLDKAKADGTKLGRPPRLTPRQIEVIKQELANNKPLRQISREYQVPTTTLRRAIGRVN